MLYYYLISLVILSICCFTISGWLIELKGFREVTINIKRIRFELYDKILRWRFLEQVNLYILGVLLLGMVVFIKISYEAMDPYGLIFFPLFTLIVFNIFPIYNIDRMKRFGVISGIIFLIYSMIVLAGCIPVSLDLDPMNRIIMFLVNTDITNEYDVIWEEHDEKRVLLRQWLAEYRYKEILDFRDFVEFNGDYYNAEEIEEWFPFIMPLLYSYSLKLSFLSVLLVVLTSFIGLVCVLLPWSWPSSYFSLRIYLNIIFLIEFFCVQFFLTSNIMHFYIFFESVLIPMYFLIGLWGLRDRKIHASYQFFMYTFFGSLFMIVAIITLLAAMETGDMYFYEKYWWFFIESDFRELEIVIWLLFFIGFAIKVPMVPFHIWLPEAHVEAPTGGSIILAAILLKFGTYGFYRILVEMLPWGCNFLTRFIIVLSLISIIYASVINFIQIDLKKIIAYSSVSHMGYVTLGLVLDNPEGLVGALFMMITHGFISGALFYIVGILYERYGTRNIYYYGGLKDAMPMYTLFFFLLTLANMNLPLTAGFVAEFLVLIGSGAINSKIIVFIAAFGLITNGIYCIWLFNRLCFGSNINMQKNIKRLKQEVRDIQTEEIMILSMFLIIIIILGIFPNGILWGLEREIYTMLWSKNLYF